MKQKVKFFILIFCSLVVIIFLIIQANSKIKPVTNKITQSWQNNYMNYSALHQVSTGKSQKIALIDSGVSSDETVSKNISLIDDGSSDQNGHGTMMYSLIKGTGSLLGIAPSVDIFSIKIMGQDGSVSPDTIDKAIRLARKNGATIINLSLGSTKYNSQIAQSIKECTSENITVVSSAGDYQDMNLMFPASLSDVVSVGAIGKDKHILSMTSGSSHTIINAPGGDVETEGLRQKIFESSGTSQATAIISGYIALLKDAALEHQKSLTNNDIKKYLTDINSGKKSYLMILKSVS